MKTGLKVSVQTAGWMNELFDGEKEVDEAFRYIKEIGFDTLDYNIDAKLGYCEITSGTLNNFYDQTVEELWEYYRPVKEAMVRHGISIGQAHASFPTYVEGKEHVNEYMVQVIEKQCAICQYLECPGLVVHPYTDTEDIEIKGKCNLTFSPDKEKERNINLNFLRRLIPAAKKYGVRICLENMVSTGISGI